MVFATAVSRLLVLVLIFISLLPAVLGYHDIISGQGKKQSLQDRQNKLARLAVARTSSGLSPAIESAVYLVLGIWAFAVFYLILWMVSQVLAMLIPFLPLAFAIKSFSKNRLPEQNPPSTQLTNSSSMSWWTAILPLIVLINCCFRKPYNYRRYIIAFVISCFLGVMQHLISNRQLLRLTLPFQATNIGILAGQFAISYLHLMDTIGSTISNLRSLHNQTIRESDQPS
jgi:hypothetical protein